MQDDLIWGVKYLMGEGVADPKKDWDHEKLI